MEYIAENNWLQTIIIFLTISSFINIFYPFTIKKQIDEKDIESIAKETIEEERIKKLKDEPLFEKYLSGNTTPFRDYSVTKCYIYTLSGATCNILTIFTPVRVYSYDKNSIIYKI